MLLLYVIQFRCWELQTRLKLHSFSNYGNRVTIHDDIGDVERKTPEAHDVMMMI